MIASFVMINNIQTDEISRKNNCKSSHYHYHENIDFFNCFCANTNKNLRRPSASICTNPF